MLCDSRWIIACLSIGWLAGSPAPLSAYEFVLKNGLTVRGATGDLNSIVENPLSPSQPGGEVATRLIRFVDDGLRRTYFYERNILEAREDVQPPVESIKIRQPRLAVSGKRVVGLTSNVEYGPFNEFGHRTISVMTVRGLLNSVQAITELTPVYAKVEGIQSEESVIWDMRIATSTLSRELLQQIVKHRAELSGADGQLALVRLLIAAERYHDAAEVLKAAAAEHSELQDLSELEEDLNQRRSQRLVAEIRLRAAAGQWRIVTAMIEQFPVEGVAGETLLEVREMAQQIATTQQQLTALRQKLDDVVKQLDENRQGTVKPIIEEIKSQVSVNNLVRLNDFVRFAESADVSADEQAAWAISGWILGAGNGLNNLGVAVSLYEVRALAGEYLSLQGEDQLPRRKEILEQIQEKEGGTPENVAKLVAQLRPPIAVPVETFDESLLGRLVVPSSLPEGRATHYHVVLPPEYDPDRRYPTMVSLAPPQGPTDRQAEWWAGAYDANWKMRMGQASRHGFIVICPEWTPGNITRYGYSVHEHAAVLDSLRHALQRFSIDTDRIYLSGHMLGGDAAWDIALAHPDLWAGLILIGASSDYGTKDAPKYITKYAVNAKQLPMYLVYGELDAEKMNRNARNLNEYLRTPGFETMLVEYQGRGNEHFFEEIHHMFEWLEASRQRRTPHPPEREFESMRPWDNFFWCLELEQFPEPTMTHPLLWGRAKRYPSAHGEFKFLTRDRVTIKLPSARGTLFLHPDWIDYTNPIRLSINGETGRPLEIRPQVSVILEDARSRGDRLHPFWSRTELPPAN